MSPVFLGKVVTQFSRPEVDIILTKNTDISAGGIVCSSGVGGIYPKDLILGTVENTQESGKDVSFIAVINPQIKINELTDVFVITDFEGKNQITK